MLTILRVFFLAFEGRYNKFSRVLSQTPWIIDNVRQGESSVEVSKGAVTHNNFSYNLSRKKKEVACTFKGLDTQFNISSLSRTVVLVQPNVFYLLLWAINSFFFVPAETISYKFELVSTDSSANSKYLNGFQMCQVSPLHIYYQFG